MHLAYSSWLIALFVYGGALLKIILFAMFLLLCFLKIYLCCVVEFQSFL